MTGLNLSNIIKTGVASVALLAAYSVSAQTPAAPAASAPAAGASNFSDADIKQFAAAAVEVTKIQSDNAIAAAEKQPKMLAALQSKGIPPEKFNAIGQAAAADPALQQRIQAAAGTPAPAAPPARRPRLIRQPRRSNKHICHGNGGFSLARHSRSAIRFPRSLKIKGVTMAASPVYGPVHA